MASDLDIKVAERLKSVDQRYTIKRRALVQALAGSGRPLTVEEIIALAPSLPKSSAYRNLAVLEQASVVRRIQLSDEWGRFELTEDLTGHHHHLVCLGCGSVTDFTAPNRLERSVARTVAEIADDTGFRPETHRLDLVGYCATCT